MTIHVTIAEAQARIVDLLAAAAQGEDVVVSGESGPVATIRPHAEAPAQDRLEAAATRASAFGCLASKYAHLPAEAFDIVPSMTDDAYEERLQRKFG